MTESGGNEAMKSEVRYPANASIYEVLRNRPGGLLRLQEAGLSRDYLEYRIGDAARILGVPEQRLTEALLRECGPAPLEKAAVEARS